MSKTNDTFSPLSAKHIVPGNHAESDYFALIRDLLAERKTCTVGDPGYVSIQREIDKVYTLIKDEIITNRSNPIREVSFGTSGWRGIIGKDITCRSIAQVTLAIIALYQELSSSSELTDPLGVQTLEEARRRGCVVGYDNRFGGDFFAQSVIDVLTSNGFTVHFAGESTTGALSAAMLDLHAAFSVNLTPSHNPLDYAGYKYNAADAGPASSILTTRITENARKLISEGNEISLNPDKSLVKPFSALDSW
ncbi:MAG: phosphoglucomutase, partial [Desulfobulbaceae bacterium]|nr:phosphoglucomutase [Desulfobulbaceae bacterium]